MRQTFPFANPRHKPPQALAALKHRIRKYIKRERRKSVPEGVDFWDFDCKIGKDEDTAAPIAIDDLIKQLDAIAESGSEHVYVEILAKPGKRLPQGSHRYKRDR
jgi:hypothetical protein